jgi:succinate dehydrogenase flavin-adding protein (antitoxin of CptAB toxin-antitoxin module)
LPDTTNGCHLNYEALHVEHEKDSLSSDERIQLEQMLCNKDSDMWRLLAAAMEQELK